MDKGMRTFGCGDCHGDRFVLLDAVIVMRTHEPCIPTINVLIVMWINMMDGANCRDVRFVRPPYGGGDCRASVCGIYSKIMVNFLLNYLVD